MPEPPAIMPRCLNVPPGAPLVLNVERVSLGNDAPGSLRLQPQARYGYSLDTYGCSLDTERLQPQAQRGWGLWRSLSTVLPYWPDTVLPHASRARCATAVHVASAATLQWHRAPC